MALGLHWDGSNINSVTRGSCGVHLHHSLLPPVALSLGHAHSCLSLLLGLTAPEPLCRCPESAQPEVVGCAAATAVALLGEPGPQLPNALQTILIKCGYWSKTHI